MEYFILGFILGVIIFKVLDHSTSTKELPKVDTTKFTISETGQVVKPLKDGNWAKSGSNPPPSTPKPKIIPPGQGKKRKN